jgi:hypothetical protein
VAAEDKTDIREAHFINNAIYVGITAAGNAQTHPVIKKTPAGDPGDSGGEKDTKRNSALTAVNTAAKLRRTCSELGKERERRKKTCSQARHNATKDHQ